MAAAPKVCARCRQPIIGYPYTENKHAYCHDCFEIIQQEKLAVDNEREGLYGLIRRIFGVTEVPSEIISAIDREVKYGKKIKGLELTIRYYYEVTEHPVGLISNLVYVMHDQYENAKQYAQKVARLKKYNETVDLDAPPVTVKITSEGLAKRGGSRGEIPYKIEDL